MTYTCGLASSGFGGELLSGCLTYRQKNDGEQSAIDTHDVEVAYLQSIYERFAWCGPLI